MCENQKRTNRILMLVLSITLHNIPEGLAVGGGVGVPRFAAPGSDNYYAFDDETVWMFGGAKDIDPENPQAGKYFYITTLGNSTGAPRYMDAVLIAGGVELFRFKFKQVAL